MKVGTCSFGKKNKTEQSFSLSEIFYRVSCFKISFCDGHVSQLIQLTRDNIGKCDKSRYLANNGSVRNNFQTILKESYWGLWNCIKKGEVK